MNARVKRPSHTMRTVRRIAPPWTLMALAAVAIGFAVACMVQAITQ